MKVTFRPEPWELPPKGKWVADRLPSHKPIDRARKTRSEGADLENIKILMNSLVIKFVVHDGLNLREDVVH